MNKIYEINRLSKCGNYVEREIAEVYSEREAYDLLSEFKMNELSEDYEENVSLEELESMFNDTYPTLKIYDYYDKVDFFEKYIEELNDDYTSSIYYNLYENFDDFLESRKEILENFLSGVSYVEDMEDFSVMLTEERQLLKRVELESDDEMFLYVEDSNSNEYDTFNNVLVINNDLSFNQLVEFVKDF